MSFNLNNEVVLYYWDLMIRNQDKQIALLTSIKDVLINDRLKKSVDESSRVQLPLKEDSLSIPVSRADLEAFLYFAQNSPPRSRCSVNPRTTASIETLLKFSDAESFVILQCKTPEK